MIDELLIESNVLPEKNLYRIPAELGPDVGAKLYHQLLSNVPQFDLVLLGMGPDGHTASLFPGHVHPDNKNACPVYNAPKLPLERVTMSLDRLKRSHERWLLLVVTKKKISQNK